MTGLGEAALAYAVAGYEVFPLRGKLPHGNCPTCEPRPVTALTLISGYSF